MRCSHAHYVYNARMSTRRFLSLPNLRPASWRALLGRLLLASMLVAAQQGALLHALGHDVDALKHGTSKSLPDRHDCCIAFHGLDHAVASVPALPPALPQVVAHVPQTSAPVQPAFEARFRSRAPPQLS